jgi:hypothetical protein
MKRHCLVAVAVLLLPFLAIPAQNPKTALKKTATVNQYATVIVNNSNTAVHLILAGYTQGYTFDVAAGGQYPNVGDPTNYMPEGGYVFVVFVYGLPGVVKSYTQQNIDQPGVIYVDSNFNVTYGPYSGGVPDRHPKKK